MLVRFSLILCLLNTFSFSLYAIGAPQGGEEQDPFRNINYSVAFEPSVNRKHERVLRELGIYENAIGEHVTPEPSPSVWNKAVSCMKHCFLALGEGVKKCCGRRGNRHERMRDIEDPSEGLKTPEEIMRSEEFQNYLKDRLEQLASARRTAVLQSAKSAAQTAIAFVLGGVFTAVTLGADSMAGGFGILIAIVDPMYQLPTIIRSLNNYFTARGHILDALEIQYAKTQCFIPYQLWPYIEQRFMAARQNIMAQAGELEKLRFVLGLTTYYPLAKPRLPLIQEDNGNEAIALERILREMDTAIEGFWSDYEAQESAPDDVAKIQASARNFVKNLLQIEGASRPRNMYLQGKGGIGKTEFMKFLSRLISEKVGNCVLLNTDLLVTSQEELEGTKEKPGVMLRILQQVCKARKSGAIIIMDEVPLNKLGESAKRVFNGKLSQISTACFGDGEDGTGISLKAPCLLVAMGSNFEIEDEALRSRFSIIQLGAPKKEALDRYGRFLFQKEAEQREFPETMGSILSELVAQVDNFRALEEGVPSMALRYRQGRLVGE